MFQGYAIRKLDGILLKAYQIQALIQDFSVLVATKAFSMGINFPSIRHVIHVGIPENMSLWIKESERAGRDGKLPHAHLFIDDFGDVKKFGYWTKEMESNSGIILHIIII